MMREEAIEILRKLPISKEEAAAQLMTGIIRAVVSQAVGSGQEQMALLARYVRRTKR